MDPHFELFTALFVDMGTLNHRKGTFSSWQRYWAGNFSASSQGCIDNLFSRLVNDLVVVGLKTNTNPLFDFWFFSLCHQKILFGDFGDNAGADSSSAFADSEAQALVHGDWCKQFNFKGYGVARHYHFFVGR